MASPASDISLGVTIVFGTSGFSANILDVNPPGQTRDSVETTHQGTTTAKTWTPADLYDGGECSFDVQFNPDTAVPIGSAAETITITFPAGATWEFTGHVTEHTPSAALEALMTATITIKVSGEITQTAG